MVMDSLFFTNDWNWSTFDFLANEAVSRELKRAELVLILEGVKLKDYKKKKRYLLG